MLGSGRRPGGLCVGKEKTVPPGRRPLQQNAALLIIPGYERGMFMSEANTSTQEQQTQTIAAPPPQEPTQAADQQVAAQIDETAAADGASVLQKLSSAQAADVAEYLDPQTAANIIAKM